MSNTQLKSSLESPAVSKRRSRSVQLSIEGQLVKTYIYALLDDGAAIMGGILGIVLTFLAAYFEIVTNNGRISLWILAALSFLFASYRVWSKERKAFLAECARNAEPQLVGTIICASVEPVPKFDSDNASIDCCVTINISLTNHSAMATMATGFSLDLLWKHDDYPAVSSPVAGYYLNRPFKSPESLEHKTELIELEKFPLNEEIRNTNHQIGWLRFCVGALPLKMLTKPNRLDEDVQLRLKVFDNKRVLHRIYDGPLTILPSCGTITRRTWHLV